MNDTAMSVGLGTRPRIGVQRFYVFAAAACLAVALVGFAPTFWVPLTTGAFDAPFVIYLHGFLFSTWMLVFLAQTSFASAGKLARHRELGLAAIAIATLMLCVGLLTTIHSLRAGVAQGFADAAKAFAIVPFSAIVLFAGLVAVAIAARRNTELHRRLLLVATASLLQPAIGRWFMLFLKPPGALGPPPLEATIVPGLLADLVIVAGMIYDRRTRGGIHRGYWVGGGVLLAVQLLRLPLSHSGAWLKIADWMAAATP